MSDEQSAVSKTVSDTPVKTPAQKARDYLRRGTWASCDPNLLLADMAEVFERWEHGKGDKKLKKEFREKLVAALPIGGLDTHYELANTVREGIRPLVLDFARKLVKEYDCQTVSEKATAEVVVMSYARILEFTRVMNRVVRLEGITHEINSLYGMVSKELDRANRHFVTALSTLRQIKAPQIGVKVNAKTAFIGGNQQFNAGQPGDPVKADYEINNPK